MADSGRLQKIKKEDPFKQVDLSPSPTHRKMTEEQGSHPHACGHGEKLKKVNGIVSYWGTVLKKPSNELYIRT